MFYSKVQEVRDKMQQMSHGQRQLLRLHEQSKTAVQVDKTRRIREEMAAVTDQVLHQAKIVKADVDYLEKANADALRRVRNRLALSFACDAQAGHCASQSIATLLWPAALRICCQVAHV